MNLVVIDVEVREEVLNVLRLHITREAAKPHRLVHVLLLQDPLQVDSLAAELVNHELVPLLVGEFVELNEAGTHILSLLLFDGSKGLGRSFKQHRGLAGPTTALQLSNLDGVANPGKAFEELFDLLCLNAPRKTTQLD